MSETSARASRLAFWLGSFARKGLIGARRAGVAAPGEPDAGRGAAGGAALGAGAGAAFGRSGNAGRSAVLVGGAATGVVFETVGRSGEGDPPFAPPALGPARPDAGDAGATCGDFGAAAGRAPP